MIRPVLILVLLAPAVPAYGQETQQQPFYRDLDVSALDATRERPLFSESRRPPEPPPPPAPTPVLAEAPRLPPEPPPLRLIGLVTMGETRVALVEDGNTGEVMKLAPGATIDEWTMTVVDDRTIAFSRDGEAARFGLFAR